MDWPSIKGNKDCSPFGIDIGFDLVDFKDLAKFEEKKLRIDQF